MVLRIGNGAGFLGDQLDAPRMLAESGKLDVLTLEYLAELTLSILAAQKSKDAARGYAADFLDVLDSLVPSLRQQSTLRIVTNAGGMNASACAEAAGRRLEAAGLGELPIAVVTGDDVLSLVQALQADGHRFENLDSGAPLSDLPTGSIISANAYLGAMPIADSLAGGARLVITGRVADASLTVGPAVEHFQWKWDQWDTLAQATVAGHLIECGAQVTGGYSADWSRSVEDPIGYPIAELQADGDVVITKPDGTAGRVDRMTVAEQLVYEIGDPAAYLTPDVTVDFTTVELTQQAHAGSTAATGRVRVTGATGQAPPADYKVSLAYRNGFTTSGQLLVHGRDCVAKARHCADLVFARLRRAGVELDRTCVELLGTDNSGRGSADPQASGELLEVVLRIAAADPDAGKVARFSKELAPLITSGPAGLAGYAGGRSPVRPVFAFWPTLIPKSQVPVAVETRTAREWSGGESS